MSIHDNENQDGTERKTFNKQDLKKVTNISYYFLEM